jgi:hypothetical protein
VLGTRVSLLGMTCRGAQGAQQAVDSLWSASCRVPREVHIQGAASAEWLTEVTARRRHCATQDAIWQEISSRVLAITGTPCGSISSCMAVEEALRSTAARCVRVSLRAGVGHTCCAGKRRRLRSGSAGSMARVRLPLWPMARRYEEPGAAARHGRRHSQIGYTDSSLMANVALDSILSSVGKGRVAEFVPRVKTA